MTRLVLDVGQCGPDHAAIAGLLRRRYDVVVERTEQLEDTLTALREKKFDLVLVNRKLDIDYGDGLAIIRAIKNDPALAGTPVMLVSNYADAQSVAVEAGAIEGFGKAELAARATAVKLDRLLR